MHPPLIRYMAKLRGIELKETENKLSHLMYACDNCRCSPIANTPPFAWYECEGIFFIYLFIYF